MLVRLREENGYFEVEHLLVTLQQRKETEFIPFVGTVGAVIRRAYLGLQASDPRWSADFADIEVLINPNGPLIQAGSDGDNGQTGRKLVADYYGPRIPIGGGALSGKHWTHIDRIGARAARQAAVAAVKSGAGECLLRIAYAPGIDAPLDLAVEMSGRGIVPNKLSFSHSELRSWLTPNDVYQALSSGGLTIDFNSQT